MWSFITGFILFIILLSRPTFAQLPQSIPTPPLSQLIKSIRAVCQSGGVAGRVDGTNLECLSKIQTPAKSDLKMFLTGKFTESVNDYYILQSVPFTEVAVMSMTGSSLVPVSNAIDFATQSPSGYSFIRAPNNPHVGDIAIFKYSAPYGHLAVVTAVRNSSFIVAEANFDGLGTIASQRVIPFDYPYLVGFSHKQ